MDFTHAIVRIPPKSYLNGITTSHLGTPDYHLAIKQHVAYVKALLDAGVIVKELQALEEFPDSCFVEDTAVLTSEFAVVSNPGDKRRNGEAAEMSQTLRNYFEPFEIKSPGTLDGGDIMQADDIFYIGVSERTNRNGAEQLSMIVEEQGYQSFIVDVGDVLHLKTGVNYLGNNIMIMQEVFAQHPLFFQYEKIIVKPDEEYAANSLRINDRVFVPAGNPDTAQQIKAHDLKVIELEMSEFQKMDGGLSCLSLRF